MTRNNGNFRRITHHNFGRVVVENWMTTVFKVVIEGMIDKAALLKGKLVDKEVPKAQAK